MNDAVREMLRGYGKLSSPLDEERALKEIIQQITLLGLYRGGFFTKASFYGGTALRMLYGLDRFSEDLDFCLNDLDLSFCFSPYTEAIEDELKRYGFSAKVEEKNQGAEFPVGSAFVKQDTTQALLMISDNPRRAQKGSLLKVKLEVDKTNPKGALTEQKLISLPVPFLVQTLTPPSLFAGKLHALLARAYLNRVKGRDYYDFLFYAARKTPINIAYLEAKLRDSGHLQDQKRLDLSELVRLLTDKFLHTDFDKVKNDIMPFIKPHQAPLMVGWNSDLFIAVSAALNDKVV